MLAGSLLPPSHMHTFELHRNIRTFFSNASTYAPFTSAVSGLAEAARTMHALSGGLATAGTKLAEAANNVHLHLAKISNVVAQTKPSDFYKSLERFQVGIEVLKPGPWAESNVITALQAEVGDFSELFDIYLSSPNSASALPLIVAALELDVRVRTFASMLQLFEMALSTNEVPSSSEAGLSLWLPEHMSLSKFAQKLQALQELYSEMCMLFGVSESAHPLRIGKIESGSMWAEVFGDTKIIEMIGGYVEATAKFVYRNYTKEGKLSAIPRKVDAVDALLGLRNSMKEAGLDVSGMQPNIEKAAVAISDSLATLLDGQGSVTVNETTISVSAEIHNVYLEQANSLRIGTSSRLPDQPALPNESRTR